MNAPEEGVNCPCCDGRIERFAEQDGSCDYCCERCDWHQCVGASGSNSEDRPTVVIFVSGGAVQGVEGNGPVRVILCDFDVDEAQHTVGGRPCAVSVWESPEDPSEEFTEVLSLVGRMKHTDCLREKR